MKKIFSTLLICSFLFTGSVGFAEEKVIIVNPSSIRQQLFSKNITLLQAMNNVKTSKLNVSMARARLLPSLNLNVLLPELSSPTFILSSVMILFPFLIPSNWIVLRQQKELFESDKASYKAMQLNVLSNALSVYYTFVNDKKVQKVLLEQMETLGIFYANLKKQSEVLGNISAEDLAMASAQWQEAKIRISKLQELLSLEKAGIRSMLGLPLGSELLFEDIDLVSSDYELKTASEIAEHSLEVAPETAQLSFLINAASAGKFAKFFGFINSASMNGNLNGDNSPFVGLKSNGSFSFGMDNFVNIQIADNNIAAIKLRVEQLKNETERLAEVVVTQIAEVKSQNVLTDKVLQDRMVVYEGQKKQYAIGLIPLQSLLQTQIQLTESYIANIKSDLDLKMQRLTLTRLVIDGDFAEVKGCTTTTPEGKTSISSIFHKDKGQSLDEFCQNDRGK